MGKWRVTGTNVAIGALAPVPVSFECGTKQADATYLPQMFWSPDHLGELAFGYRITAPESWSDNSQYTIWTITPESGSSADRLLDTVNRGHISGKDAQGRPYIEGTVLIAADDVPATVETWRIVCARADAAGNYERDEAGLPTGLFVDLPTLDPATSGRVDLTQPGQVTILEAYSRYWEDGTRQYVVSWVRSDPVKRAALLAAVVAEPAFADQTLTYDQWNFYYNAIYGEYALDWEQTTWATGARERELSVDDFLSTALKSASAIKGIHLFAEEPDQSATGTFMLDSSVLDGSDQTHGDWKPIDVGRSTEALAVFGGLKAVEKQIDCRIYAVAYSEQAENKLVRYGQTGATTNFVVTVQPQMDSTPGREYAEIVTGFSVVKQDYQDAAVKRHRLICNFVLPTRRKPNKVWIAIQREDWNNGQPIWLGIITASGQEVSVQAPTRLLDFKVWAVSASDPHDTDDPNDDFVNSIVPGVTPMQTVALGSTTGTVDARQFLAESIASHLGVHSGVFGVLPNQITNDLVAAAAIDTVNLVDAAVGNTKIASFAVDAAKIANAAIQNAHLDRATANKIAIVNADIVSLAANKITAGTLAAGVIYAGTINANQVNAGTLTGVNLSIVNGAQSILINETDFVKITDTGLSAYTQIRATQIEVRQSNNSAAGILGTTGPFSSLGALTLVSAAGVELHIYSAVASTASAGSASLPSAPAGFISASWNGSTIKIPYYNN